MRGRQKVQWKMEVKGKKEINLFKTKPLLLNLGALSKVIISQMLLESKFKGLDHFQFNDKMYVLKGHPMN